MTSIISGWHGWVGTFTGVALMTVVVLPLAALAVWVLARRRRLTGTTAAWAWRTSLAEVGIIYGTVPWVWMTMLPGSRAGAVPGRVNLVPLRDLLTMSTGQIVGNLLVFAALGFFAPMRFAALASLPRILAFAAGCSVLVEVAQYVLRLDRVSSVDDVLLNTAGAGLAALASRRWWRTSACRALDARAVYGRRT
ncbi:VanZ family protein [Kribbella sp. NPDC049174]|uniref:VanZ family protein n=1 Tax=Kribbella sp. NPDC049174 TaxID=3364112 RepID=UPI003718F655